MQQYPVRVLLIILFVFVGCFGVAYAAAGMLTALPAPTAGGTCGPSTASETALEALAQPNTIGAGPEPPTSNVTGHRQWQSFVDDCQSLADRRGLASLAIFVISIVISAVGLVWVLRRPKSSPSDEAADSMAMWSGDPATLVGAGAMAAPGMSAPVWGTPPPPGYAPYPYPVQPMPPGYPPPQPGGAYPPAAWPGGQPMPPGVPYPPAPPAPVYTEPAPVYPPAAPYPEPAPAYPAVQSMEAAQAIEEVQPTGEVQAPGAVQPTGEVTGAVALGPVSAEGAGSAGDAGAPATDEPGSTDS